MNATSQLLTRPAGDVGLLTPFWIDDGLRVLAVGAGPEGLIEGLARRGAAVTILEPDAATARRLARRSIDLKRVTVVGSTLAKLRSTSGAPHTVFDLIVYAPVPDGADIGDRAAASVPVEDVIATASELLRASGTLVLAVPNPWGLRRQLDGDAPGPGPGPLGIRAALDASGFGEQRWLVPYPDPASPDVIVDAGLLDSDAGAGLATMFVRTPVRESPAATRFADPLDAFRDAAAAGLAASIADWYLVAAMRQGASDASIVRQGQLFIPSDPDRRPEWADPREIEAIGGRWLIHPSDSYAPLASGPFLLEPLTVAIPQGHSGEDVIVEALGQGLDSPAAKTALAAWWAAARAAITGGGTERRQLGILPRDFVVTPDGDWAFIAGQLTLRFPMPVETLALRAMGWTLTRAVLARGWVPGLDPALSVADGARAILDVIGVRCHEEHVYMWQELEADLLLRTGSPGLTRAACRARIRAVTDAPMGSRLAALPASTLVAAGLTAPGLAAETRTLRARLAALSAELPAVSATEPVPLEGLDG
jgi:hypothetical protein